MARIAGTGPIGQEIHERNICHRKGGTTSVPGI